MVNKVIKAGRIPAVLVGWNMFDALLHIAIDMAEPLRITGNIIAVLVAVAILQGAPKKLSFTLLLIAFISTVALNTVHVSENDFAIPMLIFVGLSLYLLLRWAQILKIEDLKIRESKKQKYFHKRWFAVAFSIFGVLVVLAVGVMNLLNMQDQLFDGALKEAVALEYGNDYFIFLKSITNCKTKDYTNKELRDITYKARSIYNTLSKEKRIYTTKERIEMRNRVNLELKIYLKKDSVFNF